MEHLGWDARVIDLSGQRVAQEIALESEQVFGHGLVTVSYTHLTLPTILLV